jgi:S-DNA-T family DNA segregation ATPase FtsK/SpoIIIE
MGFRCADLINSRIVGTPGAEKIEETQGGRFILKLGKLTEVQAPFLELEPAKKLLAPLKIEAEEEPYDVASFEEETAQEVPQQAPQIFGVLGDDESETAR